MKVRKRQASYSFNVKVGKRGYAKAKSDYLARRGDYADIADERAKRSKKIDQHVPDEELEVCGSLNLPKWAKGDDGYFWEYADKKERKNGTSFREITLALPRDMTPLERQELLMEFLELRFGNRFVVSWAIHNCKAALDIDGGQNTHAHVMFSERLIDVHYRGVDQFFKRYNSKEPTKGGCQKYTPHQVGAGVDGAQALMRIARKEDLYIQRKLWEVVQNRHLEKCGLEARVSCETLKKQGIDREPERHLGWRGVRNVDEAKAIKEMRLLRSAEEVAAEKASKTEEHQAKALEAKNKKEAYQATRVAEETAKVAQADAEIKADAERIVAESHAKNGPFKPTTLVEGEQLLERFNRVIAEKSTVIIAERAPQVKALETRLTELQEMKNSWELSRPLPWQVKRREKETKELDVEWNTLQTEWKQLTKHIPRDAEQAVLSEFPDYADALALQRELVAEAQANKNAVMKYFQQGLANLNLNLELEAEDEDVESRENQVAEKINDVSPPQSPDSEKDPANEVKPVPLVREEKPRPSKSKAPKNDGGDGPGM